MRRIPLKSVTFVGCDSWGDMAYLPDEHVVELYALDRCNGVAQWIPVHRVLQMAPLVPAVEVPPPVTHEQPQRSPGPPDSGRGRDPRRK